MWKKVLSLCMALALCLSLLPATALAVDAPNNLYVGNQNVKSGEDTTYWSTNDSGELTWVENATDNSNDWNVKYDPGTATLTLKNATIKTTHSSGKNAVIYAQSDVQSAVSLTIELEGTNTIECASALYGIYVNAEMSETSYGKDASLTITGNGSLDVSGSSYGIYVKSGSGDASLTINNVSVEANITRTDPYRAGVYVQSSTKASVSPKLSLAVNGGSLTTSGSASGEGIKFYVGAYEATSATTSLTVTDNAIVDARNGGIRADGVSVKPNVNIGSTDSTGGIVWNGSEGTVYGDVELQEDLEIGEGETLTIPGGSSLNANGKLTNDGTINVESGGNLEGEPTSGSGTVVKAPTITTPPTNQSVTVGQTASFTVEANGDSLSYQWQQSADNGTNWNNISGATSNSYTTDAATLEMNNYQYQCVVSNSAGSVTSSAATLTVNAAATVPVESVSLDNTNLDLREGETAQLTATVLPDNASNKNVTWESSNKSVATVDANGLVTAVSAGTATITATADGKSATCTVTVSWYSTGGGPTTYAVTAPDVENGTVRVSPSRASRGTTVTITVTPDEGYELESLTVLDSRDNEIALTDKGDGKYTFTMPSGKVTVEASFAEIAPEPLPFGDVDDGDWFADAVRFVYENGMMNGVSETSFAPHATTSRSMIVTILYRLEGEPVVDYAMDFTDVAGDAYYAEAVRWAASEGIVGGYGGGLFGAEDAVAREQLAVILYRYAVYKGYDVSIGEDTNILSYADFADLSEYAIPAMQWACGAGVITGVTDATLVPQGEATRAQVAAMLMRFVEAIG